MAAERQNALILLQIAHMQAQQTQDDQALVNIMKRRKERGRRERRYWVRPWLDVGRRFQFGHYHRLLPELRHEDPASFFNSLRVQPEMFDELLGCSSWELSAGSDGIGLDNGEDCGGDGFRRPILLPCESGHGAQITYTHSQRAKIEVVRTDGLYEVICCLLLVIQGHALWFSFNLNEIVLSCFECMNDILD